MYIKYLFVFLCLLCIIEAKHVRASDSHTSKTFNIVAIYDKSFDELFQHESVKKDIIQPALNYWGDKVRSKLPNLSPLEFHQDCTQSKNGSKDNKPSLCFNDIVIPSQYIENCDNTSETRNASLDNFFDSENSELLNTDLAIIFAYKNHSRCKYPSYSIADVCQKSSFDNRPVLGIINICSTDLLNVELASNYKNRIKRNIGEILGVNVDLFAFYIDSKGQPLTALNENGLPNQIKINKFITTYEPDPSVMKIIYVNYTYKGSDYSKQMLVLTTPLVKLAVQTYFNCPTADGIMLDVDQDSVYLNNYIYGNEMMTGYRNMSLNLSIFTLKMLEDTGWYQVNYETMDEFNYNRGIGCLMLNSLPYCRITKNCPAEISKEKFKSHAAQNTRLYALYAICVIIPFIIQYA